MAFYGFDSSIDAQFISSCMTRSAKYSIALFEQEDGESFHSSWERLMSYVAACPDHGYIVGDLFAIFFEGLREEAKDYMMALDGGAFVEMNARGGVGALGVHEM